MRLLARCTGVNFRLTTYKTQKYRKMNGKLNYSPQLSVPMVRRSGGKAPLKLKHFWFLDVQWKPQICPLFYSLETQRNQIFVLALQENYGWPRNWGPEAKLGRGAVPPGPGLKPPLVVCVSVSILTLPSGRRSWRWRTNLHREKNSMSVKCCTARYCYLIISRCAVTS